MNQKLTQWATRIPTPNQSFRFVFTLMYIGITGAIAYFNGLWSCRNHFLVGGNLELGIFLVLLLGVERYEQKHQNGQSISPRTALALLLARMALFEGVVAVDCSGMSIFLYPMIPFSAYFSFGENASNLLSLVYVILAVLRTWHIDENWYTNPRVASSLLACTFLLLFMPLVARAIRSNEQSRRRTEGLLADLEVSHIKLQVYASQIAELAASEERNRLARDIHDSLGHYLTAVNIQLEKALAYWERNPEEAAEATREAKQAASEALRDVRRSVGALRNPDAPFTLKPALEGLVQRMDDERLTIDLNVTGDEKGYSRTALMALYRAAQEGLTNIQKHAQASHVTMDVTFGEDEAALVLRDDGQGFEPKQEGQGFGLVGLRERLELVRGQMALRSLPQQGTELSARVPKTLEVVELENWLALQTRESDHG